MQTEAVEGKDSSVEEICGFTSSLPKELPCMECRNWQTVPSTEPAEQGAFGFNKLKRQLQCAFAENENSTFT